MTTRNPSNGLEEGSRAAQRPLARCFEGFTNIELIIAVAIVAVLSAAAVTSLNAKARHSVTVQADKLRRDLSRVQLQAISQSARLRVSVSQDGTNYSVVSCTTSACNTTSPVVDPDTGQALSVSLTDSVTMTPTGSALDFDSLGRPQSSGSLLGAAWTYTLTGSGRSVTVSVLPITGFASVTY